LTVFESVFGDPENSVEFKSGIGLDSEHPVPWHTA
jgi:hypothetical protein